MDDNGIKNIEDLCKIKPYVEEICYFDKNMDNEEINQVYKSIKEYNPNVKTEKGLWAIFCVGKDEKYKCLRVGSSYNINKELKELMRNKNIQRKREGEEDDKPNLIKVQELPSYSDVDAGNNYSVCYCNSVDSKYCTV